jgi:hypothetical protein
VLRSHWTKNIEPCGSCKARMCYDGSKVPFQSSNVRLVHRPALHALVLVGVAATVLVLMGADCTDAHANAPSPTQPMYVRIDDACAEWYRSRHGKEVNRSFMPPVIKAVQGHPEAGARWGSTQTRPLTTSISYTPRTNEVSSEVR